MLQRFFAWQAAATEKQKWIDLGLDSLPQFSHMLFANKPFKIF